MMMMVMMVMMMMVMMMMNISIAITILSLLFIRGALVFISTYRYLYIAIIYEHLYSIY